MHDNTCLLCQKNKKYSYKEKLIKCDKTSGKQTLKYMINQKNKK